MTALGTPAALRKRPQPGRMSAIGLALAVHAAFFALIFFGVSWQSRPTPAVEVELWDKLPKAEPAQPWRPAEVPKPMEPVPDPPKIAELKPPPELEPEEAKPAPPKPDAEIAEKLERKKRERERLERVEKQKAAEAKKREEEQARRKAEAEQKKREDEKRRREEEAAKREAEKAAQAAAAARQSEFEKYKSAISAKIRGRANVPDTVRGNPEVHVLIHILPGGDVLDIRIIKSSGNPAYDSAIERGIRSASPLPVPPPNSELFPQFRELKLQIRHER